MKKTTTTLLLTLSACLSAHAEPGKDSGQKSQSAGDIVAMFDTNGDGLLSESELESMMDARRNQMKGSKKNKDGGEQMQKMRDAKAAWSVGEAAIKAAKAAMVENFDRNGDGQLDKAEQKAIESGAKDAMEWGKKMMTKKFDEDNNGELNGEERGKAMEAVKNMIVGDILKDGGKSGKKGEAKKECQACKDGKKHKHHGDRKGHGNHKGHHHNRAEMMKKFDTDGDGELSGSEKESLKAAMKKRWKNSSKGGDKAEGERPRRGRGSNPERRAKMMKKFDTDGDGELDASEKEALRSAMRERFNKARDKKDN